MNKEDLIKKMESCSETEKLELLKNIDELGKYNITDRDILRLVITYLDDSGKIEVLRCDWTKQFTVLEKTSIITSIESSEVKLTILKDESILEGYDNFNIKKILYTLDDDSKIRFLTEEQFSQNNKLSKFNQKEIIMSLGENAKIKILNDSEMLKEKLQIDKFYIPDLIATINNDELKLEFAKKYELNNYNMVPLLKSCSQETRLNYITGDNLLNQSNITEVISSLDISSILELINQNSRLLVDNEIEPYNIMLKLNAEKQLEFLSQMPNLDITEAEKRRMIVSLKDEVKKSIDRKSIDDSYVKLLDISCDIIGKIEYDSESDLELYRDLDELLKVGNVMDLTDEEKKEFLQLCEVCPEIKIEDGLKLGHSSGKEYIEAEKWIDEILLNIDESWLDIQKVAYIDNKIGKKISYSPDFDTEISSREDARSLWKVINNGYGVCNGIAQIEKYILDKVDIESEMVSSGRHSFLKLKDITVVDENGNFNTGNTILDPTWNLAAQRFDARPSNFCISYEEIRTHDIADDGTDTKSHKNDEILGDADLCISDSTLRQIYTSIGLADEKGDFPIKKLIEVSKSIDNENYTSQESIKKQLEMFQEMYPDFATCQNSSIAILQAIVLNNKNLKFDNCVIDRVYGKSDESKQPTLYVYTTLDDGTEIVYYADKEKSELINIEPEMFKDKFECYEMDISRNKGKRPWEVEKEKIVEVDLTRSSGTIEKAEEVR